MAANIVKAALALSLIVGLCQCDRVKTAFAPAPPKPTPYDYAVTLDLTPLAAARLKASGDNIVITSFFYGMATPAALAKSDELHRIDLGYQTNAYSGDTRHITVTGKSVDTKLLPQVVGQQVYVMITFYAAKTSNFQEDVIECQTYNGPVKLLQDRPQVIPCDIWRA